MEKQNITSTIYNDYRVACIYADTFFNDSYCNDKKQEKASAEVQCNDTAVKSEWKSPSDLLIGIVELTPPFTSKITRGEAHDGILAIGNTMLEDVEAKFSQNLSKLINENDIIWQHILENEKAAVAKKVKQVYQNILVTKSETMMTEVNKFYEKTLQDLENHLRTEVANTLDSVHANMISDLNVQIKEKLEKEKEILKNILQQKYEIELQKIKQYYKLLLRNEDNRNNKLINKALHERNDALKAFYRQIEAENIASTMYIMCTERKKCRIKQFLLSNYQNAEIAAMRQAIKEREEIANIFKADGKDISEINEEWEEKIKKILHLFLKFMSFSLKLLPEQTTFLLDLEKMVVLQLNEMQKKSNTRTSILMDEKECNCFHFEVADDGEAVCKEPFLLIGDTSDSVPTPHASGETLASNVELPLIKLNWPFMPPRQLIYAKCNKYEEVKALLESKRCKCRDGPQNLISPLSDESSVTSVIESKPIVIESESLNEPLFMDDIQIFRNCPARRCEYWKGWFSFPNLSDYVDYTEQKYEQFKTIFSEQSDEETVLKLINPNNIIKKELLFSATQEKFHNVGTQYSSQEDIDIEVLTCPCKEQANAKINAAPGEMKETLSKELNQILMKRKRSIQKLIHENPNLLKIFTDESFEFIY